MVELSISLKVSSDHYNYIIMGATASQITSLAIVYSTVYSGADQRKHQSSASLAFVWGIHLWPVNSLHKWPVTSQMSTFDDVIMQNSNTITSAPVEQPGRIWKNNHIIIQNMMRQWYNHNKTSTAKCCAYGVYWFNSLTPGICGNDFEKCHLRTHVAV